MALLYWHLVINFVINIVHFEQRSGLFSQKTECCCKSTFSIWTDKSDSVCSASLRVRFACTKFRADHGIFHKVNQSPRHISTITHSTLHYRYWFMCLSLPHCSVSPVLTTDMARSKHAVNVEPLKECICTIYVILLPSCQGKIRQRVS